MKTVEITMADEDHAELLKIAERTGSVALSGRRTGLPSVGRLLARIAKHEVWVKEARAPRKAPRKRRRQEPERPAWFDESGIMPASGMKPEQIVWCEENGIPESDGFYSLENSIPDLDQAPAAEASSEESTDGFDEGIKEFLD